MQHIQSRIRKKHETSARYQITNPKHGSEHAIPAIMGAMESDHKTLHARECNY